MRALAATSSLFSRLLAWFGRRWRRAHREERDVTRGAWRGERDGREVRLLLRRTEDGRVLVHVHVD